MEELEGILRLLLGASVQVRWGRKGRVHLRPRRQEAPEPATPPLSPCSVSTVNSSSGTSRASASRSRVSWLLPSRRYGSGRASYLGTPCPPPSQAELLSLPTQVTQPGAGMVLALAGPEPGELAPPELEMLSRSLMGTLLRLARERDVGAQVGVAGASRTRRNARTTATQICRGDGVRVQVWGWSRGSWGQQGCKSQIQLMVVGARCGGHGMDYF